MVRIDVSSNTGNGWIPDLWLRNSMISKESAGPKLSAIGHTSSSLSLEFTIFVHSFKTLNKGCEFNLQEVAEVYR